MINTTTNEVLSSTPVTKVVKKGQESQFVKGTTKTPVPCMADYSPGRDLYGRTFAQLPKCDSTTPTGQPDYVFGDTFILTAGVAPVNYPPVPGSWTPAPVTTAGDVTVPVPDGFFVDPEGDPVVLSAFMQTGAGLVSNLEFDADAEEFRLKAALADAIYLIRLYGSDGLHPAVPYDFELVVNRTVVVNHAPTLAAPIGTLNATVDEASVFNLSPGTHFTDPDGDALTHSLQFHNGTAYTGTLPAWASLASGVLSLTPPDEADYLFRSIVTDPGGLSAFDNFTIHATEPDLPVLSQILAVDFRYFHSTSATFHWYVKTDLAAGVEYNIEWPAQGAYAAQAKLIIWLVGTTVDGDPAGYQKLCSLVRDTPPEFTLYLRTADNRSIELPLTITRPVANQARQTIYTAP
ncbi:hypothetical protein G8759_20090 [Spirosoma aureum]|uniref:Dystroglycan-type cadherin-like domain-containing protein n=1 Tax=Spirosoma aureum TaxID=2692134 RepID=A0A6G9ARA9_9BACT|nr:hypothetical protein [Spirosoma aureum]QIP14753.1 hypothetical protein G8759_20090 [Spirosoma aureum]